MNEANTQKLKDDFPLLFADLGHIECGNGWFELIHALSLAISEEIKEKHLDCSAIQVKEKYGTLSFYMDTSTDDIEEMIEDARTASKSICEGCGKPGNFYDDGWMKVRCGECE